MGDTKIKIDLSQGLIEAEGSEDFVKLIYSDFKDKLQEMDKGKQKKVDGKKKEEEKGIKRPSKSKKVKPSISGQPLQLVKDLDLSGINGKLSLRKFCGQYSLKSSQEKNLTFCYYLQEVINHTPITVNKVFTCYRNLGIKTPKALHQSLWDTSHRKGWLDTTSLEDIKVPIAGVNYIEHDMKKADSKSEK